MFANSREVVSDQTGIHPNLDQVVLRHLANPWRKPMAQHTRAAFEQAQRWRQEQGSEKPLILDSGCGTGRSSVVLAKQFPQALVIGLDQSAKRLTRIDNNLQNQGLDEAEKPNNVLLLQAECADFWRLAVAAGWQLERHYLLYPNPWPKAAHLQRRWHGHPVFPDMLKLGGALELRSNWPVYLEEMKQALALAGKQSAVEMNTEISEPLTDFERKYQASGHSLGVLRCQL